LEYSSYAYTAGGGVTLLLLVVVVVLLLLLLVRAGSWRFLFGHTTLKVR
jgi:hypothetical protein